MQRVNYTDTAANLLNIDWKVSFKNLEGDWGLGKVWRTVWLGCPSLQGHSLCHPQELPPSHCT